MRDYMLIPKSFIIGGRKIKNKTHRCDYFDALFDEGIFEVEGKASDDLGAALLEMARPVIRANIKRSQNGAKGGRPKKPMVSENKNQRLSNSKTNGYENEKSIPYLDIYSDIYSEKEKDKREGEG